MSKNRQLAKNLNSQSFLGLLPSELAQKVISTGRLIKYSGGQIIHSRGELKPGLSIVMSGLVMVGIGGSEGEYLPTTLLGAGESFGEFTLFADLPRTHDIYASVDSVVVQISRDGFMQLYRQHSEIPDALIKNSQFRIHQLLELLDALRRLPLAPKTLKMLLYMSVMSGSPLSIKCRQSDLAALIGITRASLSKALTELKEEGLISQKYGAIELTSNEECEDWLAKQSDTPLNLKR